MSPARTRTLTARPYFNVVRELENVRMQASTKVADEERRLTLLRGFMPPPTSAARPTDALLEAIQQTEVKVSALLAFTAEVTAAINLLRKETP